MGQCANEFAPTRSSVMSAYSVDPDITVASTIDSAFYCDETTYALARERIFARSWQWIGDLADVAESGSLSPRELLPGLLDEPTLPVESFRPDPGQSRDYVVNAHWALYVENYLEGFHIPFVHAGLNGVVDYGSYADELFRYATLQLALAKEEQAAFDLPTDAPH